MQIEFESLKILKDALEQLEAGFSDLPRIGCQDDMQKIRAILMEAADRLHNNYPYFHPYYAGQMLKPPHPLARLAYMLSLWINPNNHALDGGRASSIMEKEAVTQLAELFDWHNSLGHLCSGGTMANLEALWVAGKLKPKGVIVASEQAHYTHSRISDVLKLKYQCISCDGRARMDTKMLENILQKGNVGTVVVTFGTTGTGAVDPLVSILKLREKYGFRIHADAAYGGYFGLVDNLDDSTKAEYECLSQVDSIVIDPHKHGLQPYGCGCILFRDPSVGTFYKHESPYTYFTSSDLHLGEISLECSRPGAAAVALWATQKLLPLVKGGEFATNLAKSRSAALWLYNKISEDSRCRTIMWPELDILVWVPQSDCTSSISKRSRQIFELAASHGLHLGMFSYPTRLLKSLWNDVVIDSEYVICLRSCLIKPQHLDWIERIWSILDKVLNELDLSHH